MRIKFHAAAAVGFIALASSATTTAAAEALVTTRLAFVHPGLLHTRANLAAMRARVVAKEQPWLANWQLLRTQKLVDGVGSDCSVIKEQRWDRQGAELIASLDFKPDPLPAPCFENGDPLTGMEFVRPPNRVRICGSSRARRRLGGHRRRRVHLHHRSVRQRLIDADAPARLP